MEEARDALADGVNRPRSNSSKSAFSDVCSSPKQAKRVSVSSAFSDVSSKADNRVRANSVMSAFSDVSLSQQGGAAQLKTRASTSSCGSEAHNSESRTSAFSNISSLHQDRVSVDGSRKR